MKRSEVVLSRLMKLNVKSIQEGLWQFLYYRDFSLEWRLRQFAMDAFLPRIDEAIEKDDEVSNSVTEINHAHLSSILETAKDFCAQHPIKSDSCKVFVNNIDFKLRQRELWDFFEYFGKVLRVHLVKDRKTKRSKGFGFVVFSSPSCARKALNAKKYELKLNGRLMQVLPAVKKKKSKKSLFGPKEAELKLKEAADYFINDAIAAESNENMFTLDTNADLINQVLCDNLLLEIFVYMDLRSRIRLELVCNRWRTLALLSWTHVKYLHFENVFQLNHTHASLTDKIFISIIRKGCQNLRIIDISASPYLVTQVSLLKMANVCQNLEHLNLSSVSVNNKTMKEIGKCLRNLKNIYLSNCRNIGEKGFWWLFKDQVRLEFLQITDNPRLIGKCIYMLPSTLKYINLNGCSELGDLGLMNLSNRCTNITYLDISFCSNITDNGLKVLFTGCSKIENLSLKGLGRNVSSNGLLGMIQLKGLIYLDISRNYAVNDEVIEGIALKCKQIQSLNLEACHGDISGNGIQMLCFCRDLRELNISYIVTVTEESLCELAMEGNLKKLLLRSCPEVTDKAVLTCLQFLDYLEILDLSGCYGVTDEFPLTFDIKSINRSKDVKLEIILGGTQVTLEGINVLQEKMTFGIVTAKNYNVGMLRNDRDPTLVRSFFPDSSDESEGDEELKSDLIVFKPDIEFDMEEEYSCLDEDGERLWEIDPSYFRSQKSKARRSSDEIIYLETSLNEDFDNEFGIMEEENWDDEIEEGCEWNTPAESLKEIPCGNVAHDSSLDNLDLSRFEIIG